MKKYLLILIVTIALLLTACMPTETNQTDSGINDTNQTDTGTNDTNQTDTGTNDTNQNDTGTNDNNQNDAESNGDVSNAELAYFNDLFRQGEERNPYFYAKCVMYDFTSPEELSLLSFYDGGFAGEHEITDEEWEEYSMMVADPNNVHGDFNRLPKDKIEAELQSVFGISLEDLSDSAFRGLFYLECSDSYCFNQGGMTSDFAKSVFTDIKHNDDGTISLFYKDGIGKCAITLKPNGDSYLVVSNVHVTE